MKSKKPGSKEPDTIEPALPSWKAFVIQLSDDTTPDSGIFAGRVEHLGSGRRQRFASGKEPLAMVMRLLGDLAQPPQNPTRIKGKGATESQPMAGIRTPPSGRTRS
jgi:hypothetical protein